MRIGYIFPSGEKPVASNLGIALPVDVTFDFASLEKAAKGDRLRCHYSGCLAPLSLFHRDGNLYFRHQAYTAVEGCPYSATSSASPRHIVRSRLEFEMYRRFHERPGLRVSVPPECSEGIRIDGLFEDGNPVLLLPLTRETVKLHREAHDPPWHVLYFIPEAELGSLDSRLVDATALSERPAIVVRTDASLQQQDRFLIVDRIPPGGWPGKAEPLAELDLVRIDYRDLFGFDRPTEVLFIRRPDHLDVEILAERLRAREEPAVAKVCRNLLKRLLVEGAAVHRTAFGQPLVEARRLLQPASTFPRPGDLLTAEELGKLITLPTVHRLLEGRERLDGFYQELCGEALTALFFEPKWNLEKSLTEERHRLAAAQTRIGELDGAVKNMKTRSEGTEKELKEARQELAQTRQTLNATSAELAKARKQVEKLTKDERTVGALESRWWGKAALRLVKF